MSSNDTYWQAVAGNVRAEMARRKRTATHLQELLHLSRNSVYRRMNGDVPFDLEELDRVARWLALPLSSLTTVEAVAA